MATDFPKEIMLLTISVATTYPKEILSPGNTVARMLDISFCNVFRDFTDQSEYDIQQAICCNRTYPPLYNKNESDCLSRRERVLL